MALNLILLFGIPLALYFAYIYWQRYHLSQMMEEAKTAELPAYFENLLSRFKPYRFLSDDEKKRFKTKVNFFLADKVFNGVNDLVITDEMKFFVAAEACLMITNIEGEIYPGLKNIYLMEDVFIPKDNPINAQTGLPTHVARLGEAWKAGPIILSWKSIQQGSSVIFHEFSHQLDQQDGHFDGTPDLGRNGNYDKWAHVMGDSFLQLREAVVKHHKTDIDTYGATNEAEFFAVVTEHFFTRPDILQNKHPDLFQIYIEYFKLNPIEWFKSIS